MAPSFLLVLVSSVFLIHETRTLERYKPRYKRVINGKPALPGEFPYQVSIQAIEGGNLHHCGGSIISPFLVLTAAHCVEGFAPELFRVASGAADLKNPDFVSDVVGVVVHEAFTRDKEWKNDVALLRVKDPFPFNELTGPAQLPDSFQKLPPNSTAYLAGYGKKSESSGYISKVLMKAPVTIRDLSFCREKYKHMELDDDYICVYDSNPVRGMCAGDSGGPLTKYSLLVGIASQANNKCADEYFPTIYINVSKFLTWIRKHSQL